MTAERIYYDHLAGEMGVMLYDVMLRNNWIGSDLVVTDTGWESLVVIGLSSATLPNSNRPQCRACLDWSHRRHQLAGVLGKAILDQLLKRDWVQRVPASRIISVTPAGENLFKAWLK